MELFILIIALGFIQVWGAKNPLHRDGWFYAWSGWLFALCPKFAPSITAGLAVFIPVVCLGLLALLLVGQSEWVSLPFAVVILLYSFGRGEFSEIVREYTQACYVEDWSQASSRAAHIGVNLSDIDENDWSQLHHRVLDEAGYRGFERMFAVLFWFFLLGPLAALAYRLLFLYANNKTPQALPGRDFIGTCLWWLEWPAVRVLGFSLALTGNFSASFQRWQECVFCRKRSSQQVLSSSILGALMVGEDTTYTCEVTRKELVLLNKLYTRTLWFWVAFASLAFVFA